MNIRLPISKSIANRLLLLQAIHGDPLMRVSADMPDDVRVLHDALQALRQYRSVQSAKSVNEKEPLTLYLKNCGTALRFLEVHLAQCYPDEPITLTGDARLMERKGKPTTQTTSALILHGVNVPVEANESPYITMSRKMAQAYQPSLADTIERDWSAAAFWYEYVAIHGGELLLDGLTDNSLQGDRIVADIYAEHFGVTTTFTPQGVKISNLHSPISNLQSSIAIDFTNCPDLYPAIALTCERLVITLHATGTERLAYKECNRLEAVARHETRHDHRMAMALLAAGFVVDDTDCIAKSYPEFLNQLQAVAAHFERG
ncbi:MAG: hypothetical protein J6P74_09085 [Paludibacteraceae bacterium]|nr:hypothetical protein [Paludibacteraceae bacterium]